MNQLVIDRGLAAIAVLQPLLYRQHLGGGQRGKRQRSQVVLGPLPARHHRADLLAIRYPTRSHTSNTSSSKRRNRPPPNPAVDETATVDKLLCVSQRVAECR
jgi:hypothetical protein